jgi:hypothetical protein
MHSSLFLRHSKYDPGVIPLISRDSIQIEEKKTTAVVFMHEIYALNTFLPFWRRAASTLRPFFVLILFRKP